MEIDPRFYRPAEVELLLGDATKALTQLSWKPQTSFDQLVDMMCENDLAIAQKRAVAIKRKRAQDTQSVPQLKCVLLESENRLSHKLSFGYTYA